MTITEIWCGVLALIGWAGTHTAHTSQTHSLTKYSSKYIKMFYTCKLLVNQACVSEVKFRDNAFIETRNHWSAMLTFILQSLSLLPWWGWQNELSAAKYPHQAFIKPGFLAGLPLRNQLYPRPVHKNTPWMQHKIWIPEMGKLKYHGLMSYRSLVYWFRESRLNIVL